MKVDRTTNGSAGVERVVHPNLIRLDIRNCQTASTKETLARLAYPPTCHVSLKTYSLRDVLPAGPFAPASMADRVKVHFLHSGSMGRDKAALTTYIHGSKVLSLTFKSEGQDTQKAFQTCMTDLSKLFSDTNAVTALTFQGTNGHKSPNFDQSDARYFNELLRALPDLVQLELLHWDCRHWLIALLGGAEPPEDGHGECLCPRMRELTICWQPAIDGSVLPVDALTKARSEREFQSSDRHRLGAAVLDAFCGSVAQMLRFRAERGSPLRQLSVRVAREITDSYVDDEGWEPPVLRERMWRRLEGSVEELDVSFAS